MVDVSLFIPCYNEEKVLKKNIEEILEFIDDLESEFEIFIVDDSSKDATKNIGESLQSRFDIINYVRYENGPSRRENLSQSFKHAEGQIVVFMDADLATDLDHLPELLEGIKNGYEIVIGSRHVQGAKVKRSLDRWIISYVFKWFVKIYLGSKIEDHECGFKAFKRDKLMELVELLGYDDDFKRKMLWDTEMLLVAQKLGYKIKEVPVKWNPGEKSVLRFTTELSMIPYLLKMKFKNYGIE